MMNSKADFEGDSPRERPPQVRPEHLAKLAVVYVRQSSPDQVKKSIGSIAVQKALVKVARRWGWPAHLIKVIDDDLGVAGQMRAADSDPEPRSEEPQIQEREEEK